MNSRPQPTAPEPYDLQEAEDLDCPPAPARSEAAKALTQTFQDEPVDMVDFANRLLAFPF